MELIDIFFENVTRAARSASRFGSLQKLSIHLDHTKPKYLANARKRRQDIGLRSAVAVADALGVTVDALVHSPAVSRFQMHRDRIADILSAHKLAGGRLSEMEPWLEYVDLYFPPAPDDQTLRPFRMGKDSLASNTLRNYGREALQEALKSSGNEVLDARLKASYEAALGGVPIISMEELDEEVSVEPFHIKLNYARLLLKVFGDEDEEYILNYSVEA